MRLHGLRDYLSKWRILRTEDRMIEDRPPQPVIIMGADDGADGVPTMLNAAGEITEASGNVTAANTNVLIGVCSQANPARFVPYGAGGAVYDAGERRVFMTVLTATGGGEIVVAEIAPAIAGYRTCCKLTHIWSDVATALMTHQFNTVTGLTDGLATMDITSVANVVSPDYGQGLYWRGSAVAEGVRVLAAAGQCAGAQNIAYMGEYWGEPV